MTPLTLKSNIMQRMNTTSPAPVWTAVDFLDLGKRDAIDKTLQRMVTDQTLRRIDRGLYDQPYFNALTGKPSAPDYRRVIDAVARRDQVRMLIDGLTAANELGLTHAVAGKVMVHTDARLRPITLDNLTIQFKLTAPSKLYWANRPAMRIVQALYWLKDTLKNDRAFDQQLVQTKLVRLLQNSAQGAALRDDLQTGLPTLPSWMQQWVRNLIAAATQGPQNES